MNNLRIEAKIIDEDFDRMYDEHTRNRIYWSLKLIIRGPIYTEILIGSPYQTKYDNWIKFINQNYTIDFSNTTNIKHENNMFYFKIYDSGTSIYFEILDDILAPILLKIINDAKAKGYYFTE